MEKHDDSNIIINTTKEYIGYLSSVLVPNVHKDEAEALLDVMFRKAFKHYKSVVLLCEHGFGQDAIIIARVMVELYIKLTYLCDDREDAKKENRIEKYAYLHLNDMENNIKHYDHARKEQRRRLKKQTNKNEQLLTKRFYSDRNRELSKQWRKEFIEKYGEDPKWIPTLTNLHDMATDVGLIHLYLTQYPYYSYLVHSSAAGFNLYKNGRNTLAFDQSNDYVIEALGAANHVFFGLSIVYMKTFGQIEKEILFYYDAKLAKHLNPQPK